MFVSIPQDRPHLALTFIPAMFSKHFISALRIAMLAAGPPAT
ncbi:hypothetical protein M2310_004109 [Rhizobium leguminosarum]|uniref:Uncharacterized protein n=1 Tax=Rhizobium esperanzae TaxID=1967781 RepID=A0A7W6UM70_9HYPH|nr:hypothetical protein [Rhizobium esperanzae]MDH6203428.1 hypothetical protein [Rhizobium leguminosarum]